MASLQYTAVFYTLIVEIVLFVVLILPMPSRWKKAMLTWVSTSPSVKSVIYWVRVIFIYVLVLFCDSVIRLNKVTKQKDEARLIVDEHSLCQLKVQQFYAQRNLYLTGVCLLLGMILTSTHGIVSQLIDSDSQVSSLRSEAAVSRLTLDEANKLKATLDDLRSENAELKRKDRDFEALKKQADSTHKEYMRLADERNALEKKLAGESESKKDL